MRNILLFFILLCSSLIIHGQEVDSTQATIEEIEKSLQYSTGTIPLERGNGILQVPKGFQFLNREQSNYVLSTLWGNPEDQDIIGMLVPEGKGVLHANSWAFTISYDAMGYVEDKDAQEINYDEMLAETKKDLASENENRKAAGYGSVELIGWASKPYYDDSKKVLHWAKEISFQDDSLNTLNYNLRVLGRRGIYLINAVAAIDQLPEVEKSIDPIIASVNFKEGDRYADYVDGDEVASWTVGSLVAGKILAKAGFFAVLLKFWKVIAVACVGGFSFIWKKITGRSRKEEEELAIEPVAGEDKPLQDLEDSNKNG
ncbi:DUF2167 domain-containing protein [Sphingobacterium bambusae]|uniref:DUF2167 domain-containing protein n=1 Tax=Sphingobacterium bambusae TaxID=662858 RepID=A0ABW6BJF1_9SPHI|nr:DUF2167 domain-containing protein [Sphingobacterium bambusae]WPL49917.1 DUF2167 domain-containing protein [Sphingobacterium bambusae]